MNKRWCKALSIASMLAVSAVALSAPDAGETAGPTLTEIVVTAQKRSENLQDVPISVVAITPQSLTNNKIETTADLQVLVPSLVYNDLGGFAEPFMRGVGSDVTFPNADPSVATYIDGAFVSYNQATIQNLLGAERIEVLVGPQGTLYGRNAVGGAIDVITLTPTQATDAAVSLTGGNYARKEISAHISGGVTDQLSVGLYVGGSIINHYVTNLQYQPIADPYSPDHDNQWGARLKAVYTPSDWLKLTASYERTYVDSFETGALRELSPNALGYQIDPAQPKVIEPYVTQSAYPTYNLAKQQAVTLREDVSLSWANIAGISNYRNVDIDDSDDDSATGNQVISISTPHMRSQQYSQELQLLSLPSSKVQWIGGLYFFHEWGGLIPQIIQGPIFGPGLLLESSSHVITKSFAEFAQATVPLDLFLDGLNGVRVTVGGRYTTDKKQLTAFGDVVAGGADVAPTVFYPEREHTWSKFTPKVTLDYKIHDVLAYLTFSEGFKSGVYNLSALTQTQPVNPETLKSYEIGAKAELWDRRIVWNTAAYLLDWKNIQVETVTATSGGADVLANAAAARAHGVDSSITFAATDAITLHGAVAWESSKYTDYPNYLGADSATLGPVSVNVAGNELQRAPKWVFSTGADYKKELPSGGILHASVDDYFNGGYFWTPQNTIKQSPYTVLNATLGFSPNKNWDIQAWGRNLTDRYYATTTIFIPGIAELAQDAPPRMYGLTATYKFD